MEDAVEGLLGVNVPVEGPPMGGLPPNDDREDERYEDGVTGAWPTPRLAGVLALTAGVRRAVKPAAVLALRKAG